MQALLICPRFLPQALSALLLLGSSALYAADGDAADASGDNGNPVPVSAAALPDEQRAEDSAGDSTEDAGTTDQNQVRRVVPDVTASRHQGLLQYLQLHDRQYEMVRLVAAEREFYGLLLTETRGQPQGGALILHDHGQHSHWPETVAPLRESLPRYGWTTLSIELPEQPPAQPPARTEDEEYRARFNPPADTPPATDESSAAEPSADNDASAPPAAEATDSNGITANETTDSNGEQDSALSTAEPALPRLNGLPPLPASDDTHTAQPPAAADAGKEYREQMLARIRQGVAYLNQRGQLNIVVIACGNSANWAVDFLLARRESQPATAPLAAPDQESTQQRGWH
ncbi:MAG: alpha/beta hydrolase family protein [Saccharospirillaceae bacterium]|nr:alpha/beta hydrolase family protein [Saccharospirillaceae bacterium]